MVDDSYGFPSSSLARYFVKCCHEFSNEKEVVNFCMDNIKVEIPKIKNSIPSSHVEDMENR